jgi:hypothetical protein
MRFLKKIKLINLVVLAFICFLALYLIISCIEVVYLVSKEHDIKTIGVFKDWLTGLKKTITRLIDTFIGFGIGKTTSKTLNKKPKKG